jgi:hypothetical protein
MARTLIHKVFRGAGKLGVASIAASFILMSLGPLVDHHFPERNPFHLHLYFDAAAPHLGHSHLYQSSHDHNSHSHDSSGTRGNVEKTVYLSPSDGLSHAAPMMPPTPMEQASVRSGGANAGLLFRTLSDDLLQYSGYILLAKKPPRT